MLNVISVFISVADDVLVRPIRLFFLFVGLHYPPHFDFGFSEKKQKTSPDGNFRANN